METNNLKQIFFEGVTCFVDVKNREIYSAKLHKMKGQTMPAHNKVYFYIKYNGKKRYKSLDFLLDLARND